MSEFAFEPLLVSTHYGEWQFDLKPYELDIIQNYKKGSLSVGDPEYWFSLIDEEATVISLAVTPSGEYMAYAVEPADNLQSGKKFEVNVVKVVNERAVNWGAPIYHPLFNSSSILSIKIADNGNELLVGLPGNLEDGKTEAGTILLFRLVQGNWLSSSRIAPDSSVPMGHGGAFDATPDLSTLISSPIPNYNHFAATQDRVLIYHRNSFNWTINQTLYNPYPERYVTGQANRSWLTSDGEYIYVLWNLDELVIYHRTSSGMYEVAQLLSISETNEGLKCSVIPFEPYPSFYALGECFTNTGKHLTSYFYNGFEYQTTNMIAPHYTHNDHQYYISGKATLDGRNIYLIPNIDSFEIGPQSGYFSYRTCLVDFINPAPAIDSISMSLEHQIYQDRIEFDLSSKGRETNLRYSATVYDAVGHQVMSTHFSSALPVIYTSELPSGVYFIQVLRDGGQRYRGLKFVRM